MMRLGRYVVLFFAGLLTGVRYRRQPQPEATPAAASKIPRRRWVRVVFGLVVLATTGFLVSASGIIPIKASSGHWAITRWFLNFSKERSVFTHSVGIRAPGLQDEALVLRGAGYYETGCRPCHGSPDLTRPEIARHMTPHPPYLPPSIPEWHDRELFYIVKHGIKFTGMPAWPVQQRDDEVWAMVAFLRALPELNAQSYRNLVDGPPPPTRGGEEPLGQVTPMAELVEPERVPPDVARNCGRCHGLDGLGRGVGAFPRLAGQKPNYLYIALQAYAHRARHSGIMQPIAVGLQPEDMITLARYYAALPGAPPASSQVTDTTAAGVIERGRVIAEQGVPRRGIPACVECHGPRPTRRNSAYPLLSGQYADYLVLQLQLFRDGKRGGGPYAHLMHRTAERLTDEQMREVAAFYSALGTTER